MSIFRTTPLPCPTCGTTVQFELVHSVNAGRRADLRDAILDRSFQSQPCPACGRHFRIEPEFSYIDLGRGQFFAVWPANNVHEWKAFEKRSEESFSKAFGASSPPEARAIGKKLKPRAVFGWPGLSEKILIADAGIDDHVLELAKIGILRNLDVARVGRNSELRFLAVQGEELVFGWFRLMSDELVEVVRAPKALLTEIEADQAGWKALRGELANGVFVDYRRLTLG